MGNSMGPKCILYSDVDPLGMRFPATALLFDSGSSRRPSKLQISAF